MDAVFRLDRSNQGITAINWNAQTQRLSYTTAQQSVTISREEMLAMEELNFANNSIRSLPANALANFPQLVYAYVDGFLCVT